ncbi:MAG: GNAT family N-acetyltransferase [Ferruginibacter sp.]
MLKLLRTDAGNKDFQALVHLLDAHLHVRDGEDHAFYSQYNNINTLAHVIIAINNGEQAGCGAIKEYDAVSMEVKRMYVPPGLRGKGIASAVLKELETWAAELGYKKCILETGLAMPEAIALYKKNGYSKIPNYGQYEGVDNSICFEKNI